MKTKYKLIAYAAQIGLILVALYIIILLIFNHR